MKALRWAPPPLHGPSVRRFALWGPLVGGLPYVWTVVAIPFAYGIGLLPALLAGLVYGVWRADAHGARPGARWRFAVGAIAGAVAAAVAGLAFALGGSADAGASAAGIVALHGIPAGALLGLCEPRDAKARAVPFRAPRPAAPAPARCAPG